MNLHLQSYGARLRVKDGLFLVRYAVEGVVQERSLAARQVRRIFLQKGTSVSTDALLLALAHDVSLLVTDGRGFPVGRLLSNEPNSTSRIQKAQALVSCRPELALNYCRAWIIEKLERKRAFLRRMLAAKPACQQQAAGPRLQQYEQLIRKLRKAPPSAATFRGLEGSACRIFFYLLGRSVPPRFQFSGRDRRPARDPFNAFLNYALAVLYTRVETALLSAGLNPYLGFMHRDHYRHKSLVFDFIEPFRPTTIAAVYSLFAGRQVAARHFRETPDEGIRITRPGKRLLLEKLKKVYEEQRLSYEGRRRTRRQIIRRRAEQLGQSLLQKLEELENSPPPTEKMTNN